jgi:hypothetical protein
MSEPVALTEAQFNNVVRAIAAAVVGSLARPAPVAYTIPDAAAASGYGADHLYREIRAGRLLAVRPGRGAQMRVLPEHLRLWLHGQREARDPPATGVDPAIAERNGRRRRGK